MNVRLSLGRVWNMGQWVRTAAGCMVFLGLMAGLGLNRAATAESLETQTTLVAATSNEGPRTMVTLGAHVTALDGSPLGVVNFRAEELDLGSAIVDAEGDASLRTGNLPPGTHKIVAVYQGQSGLAPSISKPEVVRAEVTTVAGFTVAAAPTALSTAVGGYVNSTITITPNNGFNGYVNLSCDGLPINTTCTFAPLAVQATCSASTCTPATAIMQIQTLSPSPSTTALNTMDGLPRYVFVFPAIVGLAGLGACKRRSWRNVALGLVTIVGVLGMSSCSQRYRYLNHGPPNNTGSPVGTYTVTIEAESSTGSQTTTPPTNPQLTLTITAAKT